MLEVRKHFRRIQLRLRDFNGRERMGGVYFWALLGGVLLYCFPYFQGLQHANELPRLFQTMAMVEEGRYSIDTYRRLYGYRKTMDLSRSCCLGPRAAAAARRVRPLDRSLATALRQRRCVERTYSNKAPGMSFLAVPVYAAQRAWWRLEGRAADIRLLRDPAERLRRLRRVTFWVRLFTAAIPSLLFLLLLAHWLRPLVPAAHPRRVAVAAYGLGTLAFTYSVQVMSHQLATALMFSAFMLVHMVGRRKGRSWLLVAAGFLGASALTCDYQLIFFALPLAVYTFWVVRPRLRVAWSALGALPPVALLLQYHHSAFGSVFYTGYDLLIAQHDAALHEQGFLGITTPRWEAFHGSFLSQANGLFYFSPWLMLGLLGLGWLWARRERGGFLRAELLLFLAVLGGYTYFITSIAFWRGGWQTGPRYVCAMLPCLVLPYGLLLSWARDRVWAWAVVVGPALASVVIYALVVATFPHFPTKYRYPLFDLVIPLLSEGYVAYNVGWLLGLEGRASLLPYFVLLALLLGYMAAGPIHWRRFGAASGRRLVAGTMAAVVAVGLLGLYQRRAAEGLRRDRSSRIRGTRETYGHFLRRAGRDIRAMWEPGRSHSATSHSGPHLRRRTMKGKKRLD